MMFQGLCALAFGLLAIFWPKLTLFLFLYVFGIYAIIDGLGPLASAIFGGKRAQLRGRPILFLEGIVSVVAGVLCLILPRANNRLLLYIVAAWLLLKGMSFLLQIRQRGLLIGLVGILALLAGLSIFLAPTQPRRSPRPPADRPLCADYGHRTDPARLAGARGSAWGGESGRVEFKKTASPLVRRLHRHVVGYIMRI
jgi:uncharacterized membrane protein HdeD (DUF308 family)